MSERTVHRPGSPEELRDLVAWAVAEETPLEVLGNGSKRGLGRPVAASLALGLDRLSGISLYEPDELVMTAAAGTPLATIEAELAERGQELAFEPADYGALLGGEPGRQTIGGVFACNLAGPRTQGRGGARPFPGPARRHRPRPAGQDGRPGGQERHRLRSCKLLAGSYGTLAVMSDVTFKVMPRAEASLTLLATGPDEPTLLALLRAATQTPCEISSAAYLPPLAAGRSAVAAVRRAGRGMAAVRLEGFGPSIAYRDGERAPPGPPGHRVRHDRG